MILLFLVFSDTVWEWTRDTAGPYSFDCPLKGFTLPNLYCVSVSKLVRQTVINAYSTKTDACWDVGMININLDKSVRSGA